MFLHQPTHWNLCLFLDSLLAPIETCPRINDRLKTALEEVCTTRLDRNVDLYWTYPLYHRSSVFLFLIQTLANRMHALFVYYTAYVRIWRCKVFVEERPSARSDLYDSRQFRNPLRLDVAPWTRESHVPFEILEEASHHVSTLLCCS